MPRPRKLPAGMWQRGNVYYARFRCDGEEIRQRLSSDFRVACTMLSDLRLGEYRREKGEISNDITIESISNGWLWSIEQTLEPSTVRRYRQNVDNIKRLVSVRMVSQLGLDVMEAFRRDRLCENVTAQTVNKDVGALRTMLNWAVGRKKIGNNPIVGLRPLPENPKEARALKSAEIDRLLKGSNDHWARIWYAYLTTGLRKMELANLLFTDINWDSHELIVRPSSAKNKMLRCIPIDDRLYEIMRRQRDQATGRRPGSWSNAATCDSIHRRFTSGHVFVTTANTPLGGNVYREFMAACGRTGIVTETTDAGGNIVEYVCLHSTRHSFASDLISSGADPKTVQTLMGHKTLDMTMKVYAKVFAQHKYDAIRKLSYGAGVTVARDTIPISLGPLEGA